MVLTPQAETVAHRHLLALSRLAAVVEQAYRLHIPVPLMVLLAAVGRGTEWPLAVMTEVVE